MPFKAILFDIGETLWHSRDGPSPDEFRRLSSGRVGAELRRLRVNGHDPAAVARIVWVALEDAIRAARSRDLREPDYALVAQAALRGIGIDLGPVEAASVLDAAYVSGIEGGKAAFPDAVDTVLELRRRGFLLAAVTNRAFGGDRFRSDLRDAGLDIGWDAEAVSVEVGYLKPHPEIFWHALRALQVSPREALMVGNSLVEDIAGAHRIGMAAVWRRCAPDAEGIIADFEIDDLAELLGLPELEAPG